MTRQLVFTGWTSTAACECLLCCVPPPRAPGEERELMCVAGLDLVSVSRSGGDARPRLVHHTESTGPRPSSGSRIDLRVSSGVIEPRWMLEKGKGVRSYPIASLL